MDYCATWSSDIGSDPDLVGLIGFSVPEYSDDSKFMIFHIVLKMHDGINQMVDLDPSR